MVGFFAIPFPLKRSIFPFAAVLAIIFSLLGAVLIFLTLKAKLRKKIKVFFILTGASASGFLIFVLLHNFIYGLFIYFFGKDFWIKIGLSDEPFFFILALLVCPIVFLTGVIGTIVMLIKKRIY